MASSERGVRDAQIRACDGVGLVLVGRPTSNRDLVGSKLGGGNGQAQGNVKQG